MSLDREIRKKYQLLEESWAKAKKEVKEDAVAAPTAGGTVSPPKGQFKNKLGLGEASPGNDPNAPHITEKDGKFYVVYTVNYGEYEEENEEGPFEDIDAAQEFLDGSFPPDQSTRADLPAPSWRRDPSEAGMAADISTGHPMDQYEEGRGAPGALKEAPTGEIFGDPRVDAMYRGVDQQLDRAAGVLAGKESATDFFNSIIEKCKTLLGVKKGLNANESAPVVPPVVAEEFSHNEKKEFPPEIKDRKKSDSATAAEKQAKCDQSIEQPVDKILGKPKAKK